MEFLELYEDLPKFLHKQRKNFCLNIDAYFGEHVNHIIVPLLMYPLIWSDFLIIETTDAQMDENNPKKIINIGKCLNWDECDWVSSLLQEFKDFFFGHI